MAEEAERWKEFTESDEIQEMWIEREGEDWSEETERLLKDPRAQRFVEDFLGQWLKLRQIAAFSSHNRESRCRCAKTPASPAVRRTSATANRGSRPIEIQSD